MWSQIASVTSLDLFRVRPDLVEELQIHLRVSGSSNLGHEVRDRIAFLVAQIDGREAANRHIGDVAVFRLHG